MQESERDQAPATPDGTSPEPAAPERTAAASAHRDKRNRRDDEAPTIPDRPFDETDAAWGDHPQHSDDWWHDQRPPHHGG